MNSIITFLKFALICFCVQLSAQSTFSKVYQDASSGRYLYPQNVVKASHSNCILAGNTNSNGVISKLDSLGSIIWSKTFSPAMYVNAITSNLDTCYYMLGSIPGSNIVCKLTGHGDVMWSKAIYVRLHQVFSLRSICLTLDSGLAIVGYNPLDTIKTFVSKFDKNGNMTWSKLIGSDSTSFIFTSIKQAPDSSYYIAGSLKGFDASVIKLNKTGMVSWCKRYTENDSLNFGAIDLTINNNKLYVCCASDKISLLICDSAGTLISSKKYNWNSYYNPYYPSKDFKIDKSKDRGFYFSGPGINGAGILKIDSLGNAKWYSETFFADASGCTQLNDKGYIVTGRGPFVGVRTSYGEDQIGLVKLDSLGNGPCSYTQNITSTIYTIMASSANYSASSSGSVQVLSIVSVSFSIDQRNGCIDVLSGGINEFGNTDLVSIYPNPSSGNVTVNFKRDVPSFVKYSVIDLTGKLVKEETGEPNETKRVLDCKSLSPSVYVLRITSMGKTLSNERLIITP